MFETPPMTAEEKAAELARLSMLSPLDYDQDRKAAAERIGCRAGTLDDEVEALRPKPEAAAGRSVQLQEVEPWPERVRGAELLDDLAAAILRHVILPIPTADALALWIAHTWVYDRFQHSPRLSVTSPAKRCGKSTLLDVLRATCHRVLKADSITASGVFRTVEALSPLTLLVDEADSFLGENEELRGILNSGFERSGEVIRVVEMDGEHQPVRFATFAPVALAGIGALPGTLEDRALPVVLQRKGAGETVQKLRAPGARAALHDLARRLARWSGDRARHLPTDPPVPDALGDREGDISIPLLSIADDAGGEWPARARRALLTVFAARTATEGNMETGAMLLADIKQLFAELSALRMTSADIVARLGKMEERPWPEWRQGKPMTAPQLAKALRPFQVAPTTIRTGTEIAKGYYRDAFADAWERYLAPETPPSPIEGGVKPLHRYNPGNSRASGESATVTRPDHVTERTRPKPAEKLACNGVTVSSPPVQPEDEDMGPGPAPWPDDDPRLSAGSWP
jgi:putative DNA primase/helicase